MNFSCRCTGFSYVITSQGGSSPVARQVHTLKVGGSNPSPAICGKYYYFMKGNENYVVDTSESQAYNE